MRLHLEAAHIERIMRSLLTEVPEMADDEELRLDTLTGMTNGEETLRQIVRLMTEADAFASGLEATIETMKARKDRFAKQVNTYRALIQRIMEAAEVSKVPLPEATLSLRPSPARVIIANEKELPPEYLRTRVEPDKTAIKEALKAGALIPGAFLSNSEPSLSVRMS
jgi:hypothetical protein